MLFVRYLKGTLILMFFFTYFVTRILFLDIVLAMLPVTIIEGLKDITDTVIFIRMPLHCTDINIYILWLEL